MSVLIARSDDLDACLAVRFTVFVEEQNVPVELERTNMMLRRSISLRQKRARRLARRGSL